MRPAIERSTFVALLRKNSLAGGAREAGALLEFLFEHSVRPEYQARHRWQPGDLVMWDNRCLLHYAVHDHGDEPRVIHRLQVAGPRPE
ncbi:MAG: TauD/TfdA family dioxygenase [Gammaproteobacteria bacterium]|nr:TauD/TfdA family dioxygenase [Gammaproteobacteria bacterium]